MEPKFRFIVAFVFIFASASGAPTPTSDACISAQSSSSRLNEIARHLSVVTRKGIPNVTSFVTIIPWMETQDKCDPGSLRKNSTPCIMKMSAVLRSYQSEVEQVGKLKVCSNFTRQIKHALDKFYADMRNCASATVELPPTEFSVPSAPHRDEEGMWEAANWCHYVMERLFSFSILSARVFAMGDPAKHSQGSASQCM